MQLKKTVFGLSMPPLKLHLTLQMAGESAKDRVRESRCRHVRTMPRESSIQLYSLFMASQDTFTAYLLLSDPLISHLGHWTRVMFP